MLSLLSATLESTADGILVVDLDGNMVSCNRKFAEMWDMPQEAVGLRQTRVAYAMGQVKDPELFAARVGQVYASSEAGSIDVIELKDGRVFQRYSIPQRLDGVVIGRVMQFRDVTAHRRAEKTLRNALAWQEAVFEGSRDAVFVSDAGSRFVMVNSAAERLTGYTREELLGMRIPDLHDPADLEAYRQYHDPIMAGHEHVTEAPVRQKDGTKIPVEFNNRRITCEGASFMHTVARDLTERRAAAAEMESHVRRKAALSHLGQLALEGPPVATLLTQATETAARLLGAEYCGVLEVLPDHQHLRLVAGWGWREGAVGNHLVDAGHGSLAGYTLLVREPVIVRDLTAETRFRLPRHLAEHGVRSAVTVTIAGRSEPYGVLGAFATCNRDFGEDDVHFLWSVANIMAQAIIRRYEEQALTMLVQRLISAQEEERRSLARELHDETGQALTSVLVGLRALERAAAPGTVATAARHLRDVAGQTLENVSRLAQGLRPSVLDDLGLVPALSRYLSDYATIHRLAIKTHVAGLDGTRLPALTEVTLYRIAQEALTNIARHASAQRVNLSLVREGKVVRLEVRDDGRGFNPLGVPAAAGASAHLGLYGIRERAALLGGTAEVRSTPGRGTTLNVVIPVET
jgi:PAS domain S-box-containing protein